MAFVLESHNGGLLEVRWCAQGGKACASVLRGFRNLFVEMKLDESAEFNASNRCESRAI